MLGKQQHFPIRYLHSALSCR